VETDYYGCMTLVSRSLVALLCLCFVHVGAQTPAASPSEPAASSNPEAAASAPALNSALTADSFYEVLMGELQARAGQFEAGVSLLLNAAKRTQDVKVFQRAVELAFQSRSAEAALQAAKTWQLVQPQSREANRALLQVLLAISRVADTLEPLKRDLALTPDSEKNAVIADMPRRFLQTANIAEAAAVVEQALLEYTKQAKTSAAAWTAIGRMRLGTSRPGSALNAAHLAQTSDASAPGAAFLALELVERKYDGAEPLVLRHLAAVPTPEVRLAYGRILALTGRYADATQQLKTLSQEKPSLAETWLLLGTLEAQEQHTANAEVSFKRYVELSIEQTPTSNKDNPEAGSERAMAQGLDRRRALNQAYLSLAQIAEERKDFAVAQSWLDKIENNQEMIGAQTRRASILAKQGKLSEARELLRKLPEKDAADARLKAVAEVQILREHKQFAQAYEVLGVFLKAHADDVNLLYEQAMMAERIGRLDEMERTLRRVMVLKPDYHSAYNALGYSLADRNERLTEAKALIAKALSAAPDDPFIQDSLGWVEFRLGNKDEALRILQQAFKNKPDPEIAAHLGEVLLSLGQSAQAMDVWKQGLRLSPDNDTLRDTLKRLNIAL
jgi:tetratricopeptide (TPR) repeat protein